MLATAYRFMWQNQEEHWVGPRQFEPDSITRQKLRQVQIIAAMEQSLRLHPQDAISHDTLARIYMSNNFYMDIALEHFQAAYNYRSRAPGESLENYKKRIEEMEKGK